jgi:His-Xaa-Ser system protein HxsD
MNSAENAPFIISCDAGLYFVKLPKAFYEREAVFAAAYLFREKYHIRIDSVDDQYVGIWFQSKDEVNLMNAQFALGEYCNEVLDQQVRLDLDKRYGALREAVYEHAFAPLRERKVGR